MKGVFDLFVKIPYLKGCRVELAEAGPACEGSGWDRPLGVDGGAMRDGRHAHNARLPTIGGGPWNVEKHAGLEVDAALVGRGLVPLSGQGIRDVLHCLEVRQATEVDVGLVVESAVGNFPKGGPEGPLLCRELDKQLVVVRPDLRFIRERFELSWDKDHIEAIPGIGTVEARQRERKERLLSLEA